MFSDGVEEVRSMSKPLLLRDEALDNLMESTISEVDQRVADIQTSSQGDGRIVPLA